MNKQEAQKIAQKIVDELFLENDKPRKPVDRLMLVYGGEEYKNPGWGQESIRDIIVDHILKSAQQNMHLTAGTSRQKGGSKRKTAAVKKAGSPSRK